MRLQVMGRHPGRGGGALADDLAAAHHTSWVVDRVPHMQWTDKCQGKMWEATLCFCSPSFDSLASCLPSNLARMPPPHTHTHPHTNHSPYVQVLIAMHDCVTGGGVLKVDTFTAESYSFPVAVLPAAMSDIKGGIPGVPRPEVEAILRDITMEVAAKCTHTTHTPRYMQVPISTVFPFCPVLPVLCCLQLCRTSTGVSPECQGQKSRR